jgi:hypothetical protein
MPRPWEIKGNLDLITADFTYVRWLGDRKAIEEQTTSWDQTIVDRAGELKEWVDVFMKFFFRNLKIFALANNHYALCRCRHNAYYAASRIMPKPLMSSAPFPFHSCLSTHTGA